MSSAAFRRALGAALCLAAISSHAANDAGTAAATAATPRLSPTRPGSPPVPAVRATATPRSSLRVGSTEYVSVTDVAIWLGMKGAWTEPARKLVLTDKANPARKLELEANRRDAYFGGLWIHLGNPTVFRGGHLYVSRTDLERCLGPIVRPETNGAPLPRPRVIALDPGHGGGDPGMENKPVGLQEKALALDISLRLKTRLESEGFQVVMTRIDDRTFSSEKRIDLPARAAFANRNRADLFLSIHLNSLFPDTKTAGAEIYVYTPAGQRSTQSWGLREEDDTKRENSPVNRFDGWSSLLAHRLHRAVISGLKTPDRGQKTKHLLVFQDLECPAVLVEALFLSNPNEARRVATPEYRQQIAETLAAGVRDYVATLDALRARP
jgi:N-acetylmuramoyl-L-alanine amidase